MKRKSLRTVVAFHTTADAMAFESACKAKQIDGRLIPVPRIISAGCGLAYSANPSEKQRLLEILHDAGIEPDDLRDYEL